MQHKRKTPPEPKRYTWIWILIVLSITLLTFVFTSPFNATLLFLVLYLPWLLFLLFKWKLRGFWISLILSNLVWFFLIITGTIIFGVIIWKDVQAIQQEIDHYQKFLLYEANDRVTLGIDLKTFLTPASNETPALPALQSLPQVTLQELANARREEKPGKIIITIKKEVFTPLPVMLTFDLDDAPITVPKTTLLAILEGASTQPLLRQIFGDTIPITLPDERMRPLVLFALIQQSSTTQDAIVLFRAFRQGEISYAPDHLVFRLIKTIPEPLIEKALQQITLPSAQKSPTIN